MNLEALKDLAQGALTNWDISSPSLSLIKHRENTVFEITDAEGVHCVLRIHREAYHSEEAIVSELTWLKFLYESGLHVPKLLNTEDNQLFSKESMDDSYRIIDVFAWIEGTTLAESIDELSQSDIKSLYFKLGETVAQLHKLSSQWQRPDDFQRHHWDIDGLVGDNPFWGRFWELEALTHEQQKLVLDARTYLQTRLGDYPQTAENYGLIHADLNADNLMLSGDELYIIDFDDAGFGFYLFELATILHGIRERAFYEVAKDALLEGYKAFKVLSQEELVLLEDFGLARALSFLGWFYERPDLQTSTQRINKAITRVSEFSFR